MTVKNAEPVAAKPFVLTRVFDAPRDLVWKAWTDAEHLKKWFGPKGTTIPFAKMDFRIGGTYHYCQRMPDGNEMWGKMTYREIKAPERLVVIQCFSDAKGGATRHPMAPTWPLETLSTSTLSESGGKTTLTIHWEPYNASEEERKTFDGAYDSMNQGWGGTLEQLEKYLAQLTGKEFVEYPSDKEMGGAQGFPQHHPRNGGQARRRLAPDHARAGRHRLSQPHHLPRSRKAFPHGVRSRRRRQSQNVPRDHGFHRRRRQNQNRLAYSVQDRRRMRGNQEVRGGRPQLDHGTAGRNAGWDAGIVWATQEKPASGGRRSTWFAWGAVNTSFMMGGALGLASLASLAATIGATLIRENA